MFSFAIKKTFFDMWDNMLQVFFVNIGMILLAGVTAIPLTLGFPVQIGIPMILLGVVLLNLYTGAVARFTMDIADYKKPGFKDFFGYIKQTWKQSLSFPLLLTILPVIMWVVLSFYFSANSIVFLLLGAVVFWTWITIVLASQYFYPIAQRLGKPNIKAFRTCFVLLFDNSAFTFGMGFVFLIICALSFLGLFMLPGITTLMLWLQVCFKLRLYKYDYLEENQEGNRKNIPWNALLIEDKKKVGKRTLRGTIFPWKE